MSNISGSLPPPLLPLTAKSAVDTVPSLPPPPPPLLLPLTRLDFHDWIGELGQAISGSRRVLRLRDRDVAVQMAEAKTEATAEATAKTEAETEAKAKAETEAKAKAETEAKRQELLNRIQDNSSIGSSERLNLCCALIKSDRNCRSEGTLFDIVNRTYQLVQMLTEDHEKKSIQEKFGLVLRMVVLLDDINNARRLCTQPKYQDGKKGDPVYNKDLIPALDCAFTEVKSYLKTLPNEFPDNLLSWFKEDPGYDSKRELRRGTCAHPSLLEKLGLRDHAHGDGDLGKLTKQCVFRLFQQNNMKFCKAKLVSLGSVNSPFYELTF